MKNAPPLRRNRPITGMLRLMPAAMCGTAKPFDVDDVREQQVVHVAAMAGHVHELVACGDLAAAPARGAAPRRRRAGSTAGRGSRSKHDDEGSASSWPRSRPRSAWQPAAPSRRVRFFSRISCATAARTARVASTAITIVRRCDRSGPIVATRWSRNVRAQHARDAPHGARAFEPWHPRRSRSDSGSPNCTSVLRPLKITMRNLRKRPASAQFSASSSRHQEPSFCGARPQKIDTGTMSRSSCGSARAAATRRFSNSGARRSTRVAEQAARCAPGSRSSVAR